MQRACYRGHKRRRVITIQSVLTLVGLIFHLYGPVEGRQHYMTLDHESNLDKALAEALLIDKERYQMYGYEANFIRP